MDEKIKTFLLELINIVDYIATEIEGIEDGPDLTWEKEQLRKLSKEVFLHGEL